MRGTRAIAIAITAVIASIAIGGGAFLLLSDREGLHPAATGRTTNPSTALPASPDSISTAPVVLVGQHYVFDRDTTLTAGFVLRPGDSVELRDGARLSFGPGGFADWQGTPTQTWSDDGAVQNLVRDINVFGWGDIRFEAGSLPSTIRFVNVNLQPLSTLGHYPLHWHHGIRIQGYDSSMRCPKIYFSAGEFYWNLFLWPHDAWCP